MKRAVLLFAALSLVLPLYAAKKYKLVPGSAEDTALNEVQMENDMAKRLAMLQDFEKKFAGSDAVGACYRLFLSAYLEQRDYDKAVEYGEKAAEADDEDLSSLVSLVTAAQAKSDFARVNKWVTAAAPLLRKEMEKKPDDMDEDDLKKRQATLHTYGEYLEGALFDAGSRDTSADRIKHLDAFGQLFPQSGRANKVHGLYAIAYMQANDIPKMMAAAEKAIEADPGDDTTLLLLAETQLSQKKFADSIATAQKLLKAMEGKTKTEGTSDADWKKYVDSRQGGAYSVIGRAMLNQQKTTAAITELEKAAKLLEGNPQAVAPVYYFLGWAYASIPKLAEANRALTLAVEQGGDYAKPAQDLLKKVRARQKQ